MSNSNSPTFTFKKPFVPFRQLAALRNADLTDGEKLAALVAMTFADKHTGRAHVSTSSVGLYAGVDRHVVGKALKKLEAKGLIKQTAKASARARVAAEWDFSVLLSEQERASNDNAEAA